MEDSLAWKNMENGMLTIKHAYNMLRKPSGRNKWDSFPWDNDSVPAHSMIVWRIILNIISIDENLKLRGFSFPLKCSLCLGHSETSTHLFFECQFAVSLWNWFNVLLSISSPINALADCIQVIKRPWNYQAIAVTKASLVYIIYQIWKARNLHRFENRNIHWKTCITNIMARAKMVGNLSKRRLMILYIASPSLKALALTFTLVCL